MKRLLLLLFFPGLTSAQKASVAPNVCDIIKRPLNCSQVEKNTKTLLQGNDNCVLALVDSVYSNIARTSDRRYLVTLDTITAHSDGYVTEYLDEVFVKLFFKQLPLTIHYLMEQRGKKQNKMEQHLVLAMSVYLSDAENLKQKQAKIKAHIEKQKADNNITEEEYKYALGLAKRFDPGNV
jgi:hypothetical protein